MIQMKKVPDGLENRFFRDSMMIGTGVWFMIGLAGVGLCLVALEGASARSAEKSLTDVFRAFPLVLVGGFLGGVIAQWVYQNLLDENSRSVVVPRIIGWTIAGALGGAAVGLSFKSSVRLRNGLLGGGVGGLVAGALFDPLGESFQSGNGTVSRILGFVLIGGASGFGISTINVMTTRAFLEFVNVEGVVREVALLDRTTTLGCSRTASILVTNDPGIAEEHLTITRLEDRVTFSCLRNSGPMLVNGLTQSVCELRHGESMSIGQRTVIRVRFRRGSTGTISNVGQSTTAVGPPGRPTLPIRQADNQTGYRAPQPVSESRPTVPMKRPQSPSN